MGLNEPAKYHLSPQTSKDYEDVLEAAAPYLEGYDEIYVITEADINAIALRQNLMTTPPKKSMSMFAEALIGEGEILNRLKKNGDKDPLSVLENQAASLLVSPNTRASLGPFTLPIQTFDKGGVPFRAGFVFLIGPQLNEPLLLPDGASIDDLLKFRSRDNLSTTGFINKIILAHELGHLDERLRNGIEKLGSKTTEKKSTLPESKDIANERKRHPQEIAADHFTFNTLPRASDYDTATAQKIIALFRVHRVLSGVWDMVASIPEAHFTDPLLPTGPLEGTSYNDLLQASKNLKGPKDGAFAELLRETLEDITHQRPDSEGLQTCINNAQEMKAISQTLKLQPRAVLESFENCANNSYNTRTLIIQKMLSRTPEGTLDHKLLTLYLKANTQLHDILDGKPLPPAPVEEKSTTAPVPFRHFSLDSNF